MGRVFERLNQQDSEMDWNVASDQQKANLMTLHILRIKLIHGYLWRSAF